MTLRMLGICAELVSACSLVEASLQRHESKTPNFT